MNADSVSVSFGETQALKGVSFSASEGEIHAIVGENGSGKSTLAKAMAGVVRAESGFLSIYGSSCRSPRDAKRLGLAMVFQEVLVAQGATILDNVFLGYDGPFRKRLRDRDKATRASELLSRLLDEDVDPHQRMTSLALDVRQWVVIARALIREPRVLILDEATAALDLAGAARLHHEMKRLRDAGHSVVIVTHRIAELTSFADRATILRDGENAGELVGSGITESNLLALMTEPSESGETDDAEATVSRQRELGAVLLRAKDFRTRGDSVPFDFEVSAGEVVGIAGLDGQGQADFVRALAGSAGATSGEVEVILPDENVRVRSARSAVNAGVAYVSGDRKREGTFPNLSVAENFGLGLYHSRNRLGVIDFPAISSSFDRAVTALGIKVGRRANSIETLSGGHQQKVLIGRALAIDPMVIVLNDPARGVDLRTKRELQQILRARADDGSAVVYLSSELEEFPDFCDRVAVFRSGSVAEWLNGDDIRPETILRSMFGYFEQGSVSEAMEGLA